MLSLQLYGHLLFILELSFPIYVCVPPENSHNLQLHTRPVIPSYLMVRYGAPRVKSLLEVPLLQDLTGEDVHRVSISPFVFSPVIILITLYHLRYVYSPEPPALIPIGRSRAGPDYPSLPFVTLLRTSLRSFVRYPRSL